MRPDYKTNVKRFLAIRHEMLAPDLHPVESSEEQSPCMRHSSSQLSTVCMENEVSPLIPCLRRTPLAKASWSWWSWPSSRLSRDQQGIVWKMEERVAMAIPESVGETS
jgi:hypothetical protein